MERPLETPRTLANPPDGSPQQHEARCLQDGLTDTAVDPVVSETTQPIAGSSRRRHRPTSRSTTHSTIGQQLSFDDLEL
jgi:hypothetical protein